MSTKFMRDVERFADLTRQQRAAQAEADKFDKPLSELREKILAAHPASGLGTSFKLAGGGTVVFSERFTVKTLDKAACSEWFLARDMKEMLSVHSAALTSFCKE